MYRSEGKAVIKDTHAVCLKDNEMILVTFLNTDVIYPHTPAHAQVKL